MSPFKPRPIRFLGIARQNAWHIKEYSISDRAEIVSLETLTAIRAQVPGWLKVAETQKERVYNVATLIAHEGREGNFAILSWWTEENMLRLYAYLATRENPGHYELISHEGIVTCVWEMAVHWFERNAWITYVLNESGDPQGIQKYLDQHYNHDI